MTNYGNLALLYRLKKGPGGGKASFSEGISQLQPKE
jgi:hypothetical protein